MNTHSAGRVFEHRQIWRVTPTGLCEATDLLVGAILRAGHRVRHVIGIAHGGTTPATLIAARLGRGPHTVLAKHNPTAEVYTQATGHVDVDLTRLARTLDGAQLTGPVLLVDDICGTGATLHTVRRALRPHLVSAAPIVTATLCRNTGAADTPDFYIWDVADWVIFPWETPPAEATTPLPVPEKAITRA